MTEINKMNKLEKIVLEAKPYSAKRISGSYYSLFTETDVLCSIDGHSGVARPKVFMLVHNKTFQNWGFSDGLNNIYSIELGIHLEAYSSGSSYPNRNVVTGEDLFLSAVYLHKPELKSLGEDNKYALVEVPSEQVLKLLQTLHLLQRMRIISREGSSLIEMINETYQLVDDYHTHQKSSNEGLLDSLSYLIGDFKMYRRVNQFIKKHDITTRVFGRSLRYLILPGESGDPTTQIISEDPTTLIDYVLKCQSLPVPDFTKSYAYYTQKDIQLEQPVYVLIAKNELTQEEKGKIANSL